jgi:hypothetical protein
VVSPPDESSTIGFPDGSSIRLPSDSFAARMLANAAAQEWQRAADDEPLDDPWAVDYATHVLWMNSPASRPHLVELVHRKFKNGAELGETPAPLYGFETLYAIYFRSVLEPLVLNWPTSRATLDRELNFVRAVERNRSPNKSSLRIAFLHFLVEWLQDEAVLAVIQALDPELAKFVRDPHEP